MRARSKAGYLLLHGTGLQRQGHVLSYHRATRRELYFTHVFLGILTQLELKAAGFQQLLGQLEVVEPILGTVQRYLEFVGLCAIDTERYVFDGY